MDGVDPATIDQIEHEAAEVDGVIAIEVARAPRSGHRLFADRPLRLNNSDPSPTSTPSARRSATVCCTRSIPRPRTVLIYTR